MKVILGVVIGAGLMLSGIALANTSDMIEVDFLDTGTFGRVHKIYDASNNVVCYAYKNYNAGGISCLKNI